MKIEKESKKDVSIQMDIEDHVVIQLGNTVIDIAPNVHNLNAPFVEVYPYQSKNNYEYTFIDRQKSWCMDHHGVIDNNQESYKE